MCVRQAELRLSLALAELKPAKPGPPLLQRARCGPPTEQVGALVAAHLAANPYEYGTCPQCGGAPLRAAARRVEWSSLPAG